MTVINEQADRLIREFRHSGLVPAYRERFRIVNYIGELRAALERAQELLEVIDKNAGGPRRE